MLVTRVDSQRVLVLGAAGLVPAALVTLLLVHQPSIGDRRIYPMLRGPLAFVGLGLALAALITWASTPYRLTRPSLIGLAWAGVTSILCIGPLLESSPRARLYALELATGDVVWATSRAGVGPVLVGGDLVVTDVEAMSLVGLDPATGGQRWRHRIVEAGSVPLVADALAAGAFVPDAGAAPSPTPTVEGAPIRVVDGRLEGGQETGGEAWSVAFPGERVLVVAGADDAAYAYVSPPGTMSEPSGAIVKLDADDGAVQWRLALPAAVAASSGAAAIAAGGGAVVVAGGERIAVLDADDGRITWTQSVVSLGKSRGYALPGSVQQVVVDGPFVFLATTPDR